MQPPPEPPPQPPPPQGEPGTPATEPTNSVIVGEPGPQTGRPPVAATIPANTVIANRDNPAPAPDADQDESDVRTDGEEAIAENAANAVGDGGTNITVEDTTPVNDDSIPWWPILVVLGVVLIGGGIWALRRPVVDPVVDEPPISPPADVPDVPDEPVPPQPFVPFTIRPALDRAYGAGPPPALDWDGPRTRIRTRLDPGATSWPE